MEFFLMGERSNSRFIFVENVLSQVTLVITQSRLVRLCRYCIECVLVSHFTKIITNFCRLDREGKEKE